jgi:hypothetical protein
VTEVQDGLRVGGERERERERKREREERGTLFQNGVFDGRI